MKKCSDEIPHKVFDPEAETVEELVKTTGQCRTWINEYATKMVEEGKWERVWKKVKSKPSPAYRRKK